MSVCGYNNQQNCSNDDTAMKFVNYFYEPTDINNNVKKLYPIICVWYTTNNYHYNL